jgi:malate dehydrogenase (oxaloacetate-decarboxylating)
MPVVVGAGTGAELAERVRQLPADVAAAFLTRVDLARARTAQRELELAGGRQALTDEDAAGIALTAACLSHLRRIDREPTAARVLVAGAAEMPVLTPLLMACGIFDVSLWNQSDDQWFPLRRAVRDADVVIDLLHGTALTTLGPDRPEGSVIPHLGLDGRVLAASGILRAMTCYPPGLVELGVDLYADCALAIAAAAPARTRWSTLLRDPRLTTAVETAVHRSIRGHPPG